MTQNIEIINNTNNEFFRIAFPLHAVVTLLPQINEMIQRMPRGGLTVRFNPPISLPERNPEPSNRNQKKSALLLAAIVAAIEEGWI